MRNVTVVSVFEQMIGRVCKIGNTENPIIIDCQNVWRLLKKKKYSSRLSENSVFEQSARDIFVTSLRNKRYIDIEQVLLEHQDSLSNAGSCEVDGVLWTWKSNQDLCKQLGKSVGYVSTLRVKGLSYPEIISRVTSTNSCEVDGVLWSWKSDVDLCKQLGKSSSYVFNFRKKGFSYPEIIRQGSINAAGSCEVDGVLWSWENEKDLSIKLGKNETYVSRLRRDGYSYTEIIRQGSATTAGSCIVDGVRWSWKNNQDLSRQLGKSANYVSARRRDGLSYPEIISPRSVNTAGSCMVDGVFWEWENDADLGRKLGRSSNYVSANRRKGLDYLEIIRQNSITFESCEVDGVSWKWKNDSDLGKQLGKSSSYVSTLRRAGLSYPEIISRVVSTNSCEVDGVLWTWKNDADLSKKLGKNAGFVSDNRQRGLSYPELIRRSASTTAGSCEVDGVLWSWKSDVDLCKQLGKSDTYVYKCRRKGLSYPEIIKQGLLTTAGSCVVDGVFWSWESEKDLSRKLGRNHGYVARLRQNGLSYPEIIRQGLSTTAGSCEVNGMLWSWKNNPDLSRQLGKNAAYVSTLIRDGLSYPEIIERSLPTINSCMVDGVLWEWENDTDLGRKLGKSKYCIYHYRRSGISYPEIIRKCTTDDGSGSGNSTKNMSLFKKDDDGNN